jgi:hypothetical protein
LKLCLIDGSDGERETTLGLCLRSSLGLIGSRGSLECYRFNECNVVLGDCEYMDSDKTSARISHIDALVAWATKARKDSEEAQGRSDERRRVLSGIRDVWRQKRDEWLSNRPGRGDEHWQQ